LRLLFWKFKLINSAGTVLPEKLTSYMAYNFITSSSLKIPCLFRHNSSLKDYLFKLSVSSGYPGVV
jgi:hypothetical protein